MWSKVIPSIPWPLARRRHSSAVIGQRLFVFGGELSDGTSSNELWMFDTITKYWLQVAVTSDVAPLPVFGHTLTAVNSSHLYVIGGASQSGQAQSDVFRIDVTLASRDSQWENVRIRNSNAHLLARIGHSSTYHPPSNTIYVFAGTVHTTRYNSRLTNDVMSFQLTERIVTSLPQSCRNMEFAHIPSFRDYCAPSARAFHSAHLLGRDTMLVFGGRAHEHDAIETCYDDVLALYSLSCNSWMPTSTLFPRGKCVLRTRLKCQKIARE